MAEDDWSSESFPGLILGLRGRVGLTQRELAARIGVHAHSIQAWEAGTSYPGAPSLQRLIGTILQAGGFTANHEADEAASLWSAARRESSRLRVPFDAAWFQGLLDTSMRPSQAGNAPPAPPAPIPSAPPILRQQSWGEAPDVARFLGRAAERDQLRRWILDERCRIVTLVGLGGIGKSMLAARLAHDLAPTFERVVWRSLANATPPDAWLTDVAGRLAPDRVLSGGDAAHIGQLMTLLSETRCLLVIDNLETVLQANTSAGGYQPGFERYGDLIRRLGESNHQSCVVLTTREAPSELGAMTGEAGPVRSLAVAGFDVEVGRTLLREKDLEGDDAAWRALVGRFGGNGLALKLVGETIRELFGGDIGAYLNDVPAAQDALVGGIRHLLSSQVDRLSAPERQLIRALAVRREPGGLADLTADPALTMRRGTLLEAVDGLRRRSLLETGERRATFTLQPVVLEFVAEQVIEDAVDELSSGDLAELVAVPLVKATSREYVRQSQERLIAGPILERFGAILGSRDAAAARLEALLRQLREQTPEAQGFAPGNIVNLLRLSRGDLRGLDLSGLSIREAYLQDVELQDVSLANARLSSVVTAGAFDYPTQVSLSADGTHVAAATSTGEVYLWRVADRALLMTLRGHEGAAWGVALSPDGRLLASGGFDGTVKLWDAETGQLRVTFEGHSGGVNGVALSADGRTVASGGYDGTVRLWDTLTGRATATLNGHTAGVNGVALQADGAVVVSGSWDGTVRLWEAASGRLVHSMSGHTGGVWGVALNGPGSIVASGSFDGTVRLWDAHNGGLRAVLHGHTGGVRGVALSDDGQLVVSGSYDGTVRLWTTETGQLLATLQEHAGGVWGVSVGDDGALVASASYDGTVKLWEAESRRLIASFQGQTGGVWSVAASDDGALVASAGVDATIRLWHPATAEPPSVLRGHTGGVWGIALSDDGATLASGSFDGTVRLWNTVSHRLLTTLRGHVGGIRGISISGDGRLVASGGFDGTVRLWEAPSGRPLATIRAHAGGVWGVAVSHDGTRVVSGGYDEAVKLWEAPGGELLATLRGHAGGVRGVAIAEDHTVIASSGVDETVRIWDAESGRLLQTLAGHLGGALDVALTHDGRLAVSGSEDGIVRLWDVASGTHLATVPGHTGQVYGVTALRTGQIVTGSIDGSVRIWEIGTPEDVRVLQADRRYERLNVSGVTGLTDAQRQELLALGAVDDGPRAR